MSPIKSHVIDYVDILKEIILLIEFLFNMTREIYQKIILMYGVQKRNLEYKLG